MLPFLMIQSAAMIFFFTRELLSFFVCLFILAVEPKAERVVANPTVVFYFIFFIQTRELGFPRSLNSLSLLPKEANPSVAPRVGGATTIDSVPQMT